MHSYNNCSFRLILELFQLLIFCCYNSLYISYNKDINISHVDQSYRGRGGWSSVIGLFDDSKTIFLTLPFSFVLTGSSYLGVRFTLMKHHLDSELWEHLRADDSVENKSQNFSGLQRSTPSAGRRKVQLTSL